jgi:SAM-dependent methyltransferase
VPCGSVDDDAEPLGSLEDLRPSSAGTDGQMSPTELDPADLQLDVVGQPRGETDGAVRQVRFAADTTGWPDRVVFRDVVERSGAPVLDLGCATGRLLLEYLGDGIEVVGVDASPAMLDLVRAKAHRLGLAAPPLYHQRIEKLSLPLTFRTILAASSALQLVTDPAAADEAARRVFDHLQPGGTFAGSFAFDWRPGEPLDTGWELLFEVPRPDDGAVVRSWTRERRDPEQQLWHAEQRFEVELDGAVIESEHHQRSPEGRWYRQDQARSLLGSAGFVDIELFHGFTHDAADPEDRLFWFTAVRPG